MKKLKTTEKNIEIYPKVDNLSPLTSKSYSNEKFSNFNNKKEKCDSQNSNDLTNTEIKKCDISTNDDMKSCLYVNSKSKWKKVANVFYTVTSLQKEKVEKVVSEAKLFIISRIRLLLGTIRKEYKF